MESINNKIIYRFSINLFFVFFLGFFNVGFSQNQVKTEAPKSYVLSEKTMVSENIVFTNNPEQKPILLDIYRPKNISSQKLPVVIYIHGGGWVEGDKEVHADTYIESMILKLVEKQYAVISMNYTLISPTVHFPAPICDTKDAVRWVRKNADKYNFDVNNIGFFGTSAGAHLSMLAAYTKDDEFVGNPELAPYSARINYVVNNFGPSDLNKLLHTRAGKVPIFFIGLFIKEIVDLREKLVLGMTGYDIKKDKRKAVEYFETISPINYVKDGIPTLIVQGNKDKVVPIKQSKKLHRKLKKENIQNSLIIVQDGNHGFRTTDKAYLNQLTDEMVNFIEQQKK